jgi:hypothetical protein
MTITFTLASGSSATAAGPFNISGTTDGGSSNTVSIATGVTKAQLLTGHTVTNVTPENITGGTITSTGSCNTTTTWSVTPTPTPTATASPCECLSVYNESGDRSIIFQYVRCVDGISGSLTVARGDVRTVCIQEGTDITSDDIELLTTVACADPCTTNGDCVECV